MDEIGKALRRVQDAAVTWRRRRALLELEIRAAIANGATLRAIAEAAGVSHEQVRRIRDGEEQP